MQGFRGIGLVCCVLFGFLCQCRVPGVCLLFVRQCGLQVRLFAGQLVQPLQFRGNRLCLFVKGLAGGMCIDGSLYGSNLCLGLCLLLFSPCFAVAAAHIYRLQFSDSLPLFGGFLLGLVRCSQVSAYFGGGLTVLQTLFRVQERIAVDFCCQRFVFLLGFLYRGCIFRLCLEPRYTGFYVFAGSV